MQRRLLGRPHRRKELFQPSAANCAAPETPAEGRRAAPPSPQSHPSPHAPSALPAGGGQRPGVEAGRQRANPGGGEAGGPWSRQSWPARGRSGGRPRQGTSRGALGGSWGPGRDGGGKHHHPPRLARRRRGQQRRCLPARALQGPQAALLQKRRLLPEDQPRRQSGWSPGEQRPAQ